MPLTLALTEAQATTIGDEAILQLIAGYDQAFPDLQLIVDVLLVEEIEMQRINQEQRSINEPTDVLSFPTLPDLAIIQEQARRQPTLIGSVVICPETAEKYQETLIQLLHHGLLHLLGYDHESDFPAWMSEEKRILEILEHQHLFIPPVPYETV